MITDIEKQWDFEVNGFMFKIQRNKRKDYFLSIITNSNNKEYLEKIVPIKVNFLTLKGAKHHATAMIEMYNHYKNK